MYEADYDEWDVVKELAELKAVIQLERQRYEELSERMASLSDSIAAECGSVDVPYDELDLYFDEHACDSD